MNDFKKYRDEKIKKKRLAWLKAKFPEAKMHEIIAMNSPQRLPVASKKISTSSSGVKGKGDSNSKRRTR